MRPGAADELNMLKRLRRSITGQWRVGPSHLCENTTMRFNCEVYIRPRRDILDPQGDAVKAALANLSFPGVESVKVGRYLVLELTADNEGAASKQMNEMCEKLLANPIIEDFEIKVTPL